MRFALRATDPIPIECERLDIGALAGLSPLEAAKRTIHHGNRTVELGQFFDVEANGTDELHFSGDLSNVHGLGQGMTGGTVCIDGAIGRRCGAMMAGGTVRIDGGAGGWLGCEMKGGTIRLTGTAGPHAGGAFPGSRRGMTGGSIRIGGHAGPECAATMRRGTVVVDGDVGEFAAAAMIAGTLVVRGKLGGKAGAGMKRGTIVALGGCLEVSPGHRFSCTAELAYLNLLFARIGLSGPPPAVRVHRGDLLTGGRGELLVAV